MSQKHNHLQYTKATKALADLERSVGRLDGEYKQIFQNLYHRNRQLCQEILVLTNKLREANTSSLQEKMKNKIQEMAKELASADYEENHGKDEELGRLSASLYMKGRYKTHYEAITNFISHFTMQPSKRFTLNSQDLRKVAKNALTFLAPALLVFLVEIQAGHSPKEAVSVLYLWGLNTAIDLLRKFIAQG